jgi:hypothetical protein
VERQAPQAEKKRGQKMAALLKLRNFQFRFIDFLACADAKSSRDAKPRSRRTFVASSTKSL